MKQYRIDDLLANGEQWFDPLDDETFEALAKGVNGRGELTVPIILSESGRLLDGHHRLMALQRHGRKVVTEAEVRIDHLATDPESEAVAAIGYQVTRRQLDGPAKAKLVRSLMRRFGWSQVQVAKHLGVSQPSVSQLLTRNPDPDAPVPTKVTGPDGEEYPVEPRAKRAAKPASPGNVIDDYARQIGNPGWAMWLHQWAATAPEEERRTAAEGLKDIARVCAMLAEGIVPEDHEGGSDEPF